MYTKHYNRSYAISHTHRISPKNMMGANKIREHPSRTHPLCQFKLHPFPSAKVQFFFDTCKSSTIKFL